MFQRKTVDAVMATFRKTISELNAVAVEHRHMAEQHEDVINHHLTLMRDAQQESERAERLIGKFTELVS